MDEQKIRPLTAQELHANGSGFLDLRPDGYALHHKSKRLSILEFTRAMDSSEDREEKKDAEKRNRYTPVLEFSAPVVSVVILISTWSFEWLFCI